MYTLPLAFPCCHALLPNKNRTTYETLFRSLRTAISNLHGNLGSVHTVLLDFEAAAHHAVHSELGINARGCTFHLGQCLTRRIQHEGLQDMYRNPDPATQGDSPFRIWIGLLKSLALLPQDLVLPTWQNWLSYPPNIADPITYAKYQRIATYFEVSC